MAMGSPINGSTGTFISTKILLKNESPKNTNFAKICIKMPAKFYVQGVKTGLKNKRELSVFLDRLVHKHIAGIKTVHLNYIFCNDDYLLQINKEFLEHDSYTDIITFNLSEKINELSAEIYISINRVQENAGKYLASYNHELHRVIFHGALHLCGFKDKKDADKKEMYHQENLCLKEYFKNEADAN
jgi:probable rRNA maturation factor